MLKESFVFQAKEGESKEVLTEKHFETAISVSQMKIQKNKQKKKYLLIQGTFLVLTVSCYK